MQDMEGLPLSVRASAAAGAVISGIKALEDPLQSVYPSLRQMDGGTLPRRN